MVTQLYQAAGRTVWPGPVAGRRWAAGTARQLYRLCGAMLHDGTVATEGLGLAALSRLHGRAALLVLLGPVPSLLHGRAALLVVLE